MTKDEILQERRNDYDVTNQVQVSSPSAVRNAVRQIYGDLYPANSFDPVWLAFHDFERAFTGEDPEYFGIETPYHDIQHTLDMTLALARLLSGYEASVEAGDRLGPDRVSLGLIAALFHDSGYLRHRERDRDSSNGAQFTLSHVSRSAAFLEQYLPRIGLEAYSPIASQIVHFTGYEMNLDQIELDDPRDSAIGHLLGTADLMAQLADRCYLEKCRDRLFPEFVLGGIAIEESPTRTQVRYRSGRDLLAQTLEFYQRSARQRLQYNFGRAYRYVEAYFDGENPYIAFIQKNLAYLSLLIANGKWSELRRHPPCVTPDPRAEAHLSALALRHIRNLADSRKIVLKGGATLRPALSY